MDSVYHKYRQKRHDQYGVGTPCPSSTTQNWRKGPSDKQHAQYGCCYWGVNSRLQLCNFRLSAEQRMCYVLPEWGKGTINLGAASHKIGKWLRNYLVSSILSCTTEDYRPFLQNLNQTVVEPCRCGFCGDVHDHQDTMAEPFQ